jgi:hypothetical protein
MFNIENGFNILEVQSPVLVNYEVYFIMRSFRTHNFTCHNHLVVGNSQSLACNW